MSSVSPESILKIVKYHLKSVFGNTVPYAELNTLLLSISGIRYSRR